MARFAVAATALAALSLSACADDNTDTTSPARSPTANNASPSLQIGVTLPVFADFVLQIAGDNVEVFSILPLGADPHTYEPTPSDIQRITEADVIFVNDLDRGIEGSILDVIENNKSEDSKVIPFMPNIPSPGELDLSDPVITAAEADDNPHLWLDPLSALHYASVMAETLLAEDHDAAFYTDRLARYSDELSQLNDDITAAIDRIPPQNRKLVTPHDAFPHLARRYGLELVGFVVPGPGREPSPRDIADLTEAIEDEGVPAVFTEPQVEAEGRLLERIAADVGVQVCTLYSDSLTDQLPTYLDMMRFNADELVRCLAE